MERKIEKYRIKTAKEKLKKRIKIKLNRLASNLNIKLIKRSNKFILGIAEFISNGNKIKIELIDWNFNGKCEAYSNDIPFGILSPSSYLHIETMNIIYSNITITKLSVIPKEMILPSFLKYVCQLIKEYLK